MARTKINPPKAKSKRIPKHLIPRNYSETERRQIAAAPVSISASSKAPVEKVSSSSSVPAAAPAKQHRHHRPQSRLLPPANQYRHHRPYSLLLLPVNQHRHQL